MTRTGRLVISLSTLTIATFATTAFVVGCSSASAPASRAAPVTAMATAIADGGGRAEDAGGPPGTLANGCPTNSGYVGDDMCLPPPPPSQGFQLHYGPTGYANAADTMPFVLAPNHESVDCFFLKTPNPTDVYVSGFQFTMRPGSHHLLVNQNATVQPDGFGVCGLNDQALGGLGASQTPKVDELQDPAPENQGLAIKVPANAQAVINFHVIDTGDQPLLREAWLNYSYIDPSQVKGIRGGVALVGGTGFYITPGTNQTYTYSCSPDRPVRILSLASHMHTHATRMTAWKVAGNESTLVYQSFDWAEPPSFRYDSVTQNPVTDLSTRTAGAISGPLVVHPGESMRWECAINNTSDQILTFRNEVLTGEMCLLGGSAVAADDPMNPYDFSCTRN
jgi:hypothetical protein